MKGESTGERTAAVSRAQRDRLIDRVRNITSRIENAKTSAMKLDEAEDEAEFETPINRNILNHVLAGILGVLTGVLLIAAVAAILR